MVFFTVSVIWSFRFVSDFVLPEFAQAGVSNFFKNLTEVANLMNPLLQFKIVKAVNTFGRIAINTTVGIGGLIDVESLRLERAVFSFCPQHVRVAPTMCAFT